MSKLQEHTSVLGLRNRLRKTMVTVAALLFVLSGSGIFPNVAIGQTQTTQSSASEATVEKTKTKAKSRKRVKKKRKQKRKKKRRKSKKRAKKRKGNKAGKKLPNKGVAETPVAPAPTEDPLELDLSDVSSSTSEEETKPKPTKTQAPSIERGFDFSGEQAVNLSSLGVLDFGTPRDELYSKANVDIKSYEYQAFVNALDLMASSHFEQAAIEFDRFQRESSFAPYVEESEYQLAKVLFKLGLFHGAFDGFRAILQKGLEHRRFQKAIEWLFFLSRKLPNNQEVLAQLARFRDVTFPDEYADEHRYLVSKYIFTKAYQSTLDAREISEVKAASVGDESSVLDFDEKAENSDAAALDFGPKASAEPIGNDNTLDFGDPSPQTSVSNKPILSERPERQWGRDLLNKIKKSSFFYTKSRYLLGLYEVLSQADQEAVNHFQEVVRLTNPRIVDEPDLLTRELAILSLARMHYSHQQFDRSVYYYGQIDRDSSLWLTSLFESSWSFFRRGDFERALGNLLTLHSPFFEEYYFPESILIKSIIYYEACRYDEARRFTKNFLARYRPLMEKLQSTASMSGFESLAPLLLGNSDVTQPQVAMMVMEWVKRDPDLRAARNRLLSFQKEQEILARLEPIFNEAPLGKELSEVYSKGKTDLIAGLSLLAKKRLGEEGRALKELLAQSLRIQLEVARAERERIQRKMRGQSVAAVAAPANLNVEVDEEHLYWPYEGEFWRDELGTYEVAFSMCREEKLPVSPKGE